MPFIRIIPPPRLIAYPRPRAYPPKTLLPTLLFWHPQSPTSTLPQKFFGYFFLKSSISSPALHYTASNPQPAAHHPVFAALRALTPFRRPIPAPHPQSAA